MISFIRSRGRFSPGFVTTIVTFYPVAIAAFIRAHAETRLSVGEAILGAILMAFPIVMLHLNDRPYFRQV